MADKPIVFPYSVTGVASEIYVIMRRKADGWYVKDPTGMCEGGPPPEWPYTTEDSVAKQNYVFNVVGALDDGEYDCIAYRRSGVSQAPATDEYVGYWRGWVKSNALADIDINVSTRASQTTLDSLAGIFSGITSLVKILRGLYRKDAMDATAKTEINSGGGSYDETTDSAQAIADQEAETYSRVSNMGISERVNTNLVDVVQEPSGDNWIKVEVHITDDTNTKFDPADITDPGGPQVYNGVGAEFEDQGGNKVVMYADNLGSPLSSVAICHHTAQANQPQLLERESAGLYYFWANATADGNKLPLGRLTMRVGYFNIAQADATYGASYINDTTPTSHMDVPFSVLVQENMGLQGIADQITGLGSPMQTGEKVQLAATQPDYAPAKASDAMTLTGAYDAAKTAASQASVNTANSTLSSIVTSLSTMIADIWAYATRKLTSAMTDEGTDMAGGYYMNGSKAVTITVYLTDTTIPIADVSVTVMNAAKTLSLGTVRTDVGGQTKDAGGADLVMLDSIADGYKVLLRKAGVIFAETTLSQADVDAGEKTIYGTAFVPNPAAPGYQTVYGQVFEQDGSPAVGVEVTSRIAANSQVVGGVFVSTEEQTVVTDSDGYFQLSLPVGAREIIEIEDQGRHEITVAVDPDYPDRDYRDLASYFSQS